MDNQTAWAIASGCVLIAVLAVIIGYQVVLARARRDQRSLSTRQRQRQAHWSIRIDDALARRKTARRHAAERLALKKRRKR